MPPTAAKFPPATSYLVDAMHCSCKPWCNTRRSGCYQYGLVPSLPHDGCEALHCSNITLPEIAAWILINPGYGHLHNNLIKRCNFDISWVAYDIDIIVFFHQMCSVLVSRDQLQKSAYELQVRTNTASISCNQQRSDADQFLVGYATLARYPAGTHIIPKTSPRKRFQDVQNLNSEDVHKTWDVKVLGD